MDSLERDGLDAAVEVRELDDAGRARWDAFVNACPDATLFHRSAWRPAIEQGLGHECHFLFAERRGRIVGLLPLVHVRSRLFGRSLIATGFTVGGGPVALDPTAWAALDARAVALADRLGVDFLEYRCRRPSAPPDQGWQARSGLYASFCKRLDPDPDKNLTTIPRKQRAMIRKGIAFGLTGKIDDTVDHMHHVYAESTRNLGTPVFPKRYFRALREHFGPDCEVLSILHEGRPVAAVMSFHHKSTVMPYYGGGTAEARNLAANDVMYWEVMRRAAERGSAWFDFGRSKLGTGAFAFKKNWGFEPEPLEYSYYLRTLDHLPELNPTNPKYQRMIALWRRLPLPVAKLIGPLVARNLG